MDDRRLGAVVIDNCPKLSTTRPTNEGIALQSFEPRSCDPRSGENGQDVKCRSPETAIRAKLGYHLGRFTSTLDDGLRNRANDIIVMVFKVQKLSWIAKHFTFYRIHATYFIMLGTFGTVVIYMLPLSDSRQLSFVDAVYTSFSVLCGIGFQTIRAQDLTYFHLLVIWLLMNLGAPVLTSLLPLYIRKLYFHLCIKQNTEDDAGNPGLACKSLAKNLKACKAGHDAEGRVVNSKAHLQHLDVCLKPNPLQVPILKTDIVQGNVMNSKHAQCVEVEDENWRLRIFVDASEAFRTLEYRALTAIARLVVCFFVGFQVIGFIIGALYLLTSPNDTRIVVRQGINPTFFVFFTSTAAFTNAGYFLTNDSMIPFQGSSFLLILYSILPLLGNTLYPPFLRLLVWIHHKTVGAKHKPVYEYLLRHPRRCFISLFPKSQAMWLVVAFVSFTSMQFVFLCTLEWDMALAGMNTMQKLVVGGYQAVSTRNGGGTVVDLYQLAPAILFFSLVMMYISAYPVFLSLQTSNNINDYDDTELIASRSSRGQVKKLNFWDNVIAIQSRKLLARDTSYLVFAIMFLCLSESKSIKEDPLNFSIFNIVFEVISAYGSIGLSIGYHCELHLDMTLPCEEVPYSFSGTWTSAGKLILVVIMLCGRHRGLPSNIDSAVRLPTKTLSPTLPQISTLDNNVSPLPQAMAPSNQGWERDVQQHSSRVTHFRIPEFC